ncbi:MAG: aminopeptidase N [Stackebrandtia sp.]
MSLTHNLTRAEARERSRLLTVDSYDVELDLTGDSTFTSRTTARFTCTEPGASTFVEVAAASIETALLNGEKLDISGFSPSDGLRLPELAADNELVIEAVFDYSSNGQGLHRLTDPVDGEVYLFTHFESNDAQRMYACFDQPDLKARFDLRVTIPERWRAISNMPARETRPDGNTRIVGFEQLPPTPTAWTTLCAGPFREFTDHHDGIDLGIYVRSSTSEHMDADEVFTLTKSLLDHYHRHFGVRYPLPKYDQVAIPEYNAGATENFGCVVFAERFFVFRSKVPRSSYELRASVMAHEMAHMWFGDLVTMPWWDELWLKESFASWCAPWALSEATGFTGAWTTLQVSEKTAAYIQDGHASTHPIRTEIPDVYFGRTNYDQITYCKGAAVLKQLASYVGIDGFCAGLREYFERHQWGVAGFGDLLAALESASGRDLSAWSGQWLDSAGYNTLRADTSVDESGAYTGIDILQTAPAALPTLRDHRLAVGLYDRENGRLTRRRRVELDIGGERTPVPELVGEKRPDLLLLNDDDLSYADVRLDETSLATVRGHLADFADPLPRALCWSSLWAMTRDGELSGAEFIDLAARVLPSETHSVTTFIIHMFTGAAYRLFVPAPRRAAVARDFAASCLDAVGTARPGSGDQLSWAQTYADYALDAGDTARLRSWLAGDDVPEGLSVDTALRWKLVRGLARTDAIDEANIAAEAERDDTTDGRQQALAARAARPTQAAKDWAFDLLSGPELSNNDQRALAPAFWQPDQDELLQPYVEQYLRLITERARQPDQDRALGTAVYAARLPVSAATVTALEGWLADEEQDIAQRRYISDARDEQLRALRNHAHRRSGGLAWRSTAGGFMTSWVALLRGINVGGHKKLPMAELRALFAELGYPGARTFIQSGNVVFDADTDAETLRASIEAGIAGTFGFEVPVLVRDKARLEAVLAANPFAGRDLEPSKLAVVFLSAPLTEATVPDGHPEEAGVGAGELFIYYPNGMGKSKLDRSVFWKQLGDTTTTVRNWRTVNKLREMMDG